MACDSIILFGDLNFYEGVAECWGPKAVLDPFSNFFMDVVDQRGLIDVVPLKLNPTWRNRRCGEEHIAKRMDKFLVTKHLVSLINFVRQ